MSKHTSEPDNDLGTLAEDAKALLTATADVAGDKVAAARDRLNAALEKAKEMAAQLRDRTVKTAKAVDKTVHENPYKAIAIGVGVGAILGYIIARRRSGGGED